MQLELLIKYDAINLIKFKILNILNNKNFIS